MKKHINTARIEGRVYESDLTIKKVQNENSPNWGKDFISGTVDVATDEEGLNVIQVHYTYVPEFLGSGKPSPTYSSLLKIMSGSTWVKDGKDAALKVKLSPSLALNDFYTGDNTLVSQKRNEGGFVNIVTNLASEDERNRFDMDTVITGITKVEADPEKGTVECLNLRGYVFNFKNDVLPMTFVVYNPNGIAYFENQDISQSNPLYTKVWGSIRSGETTVSREEQSAFGGVSVVNYKKTIREWVITGASPNPYEFDDERTLTANELHERIQNREVYLAGVKKARDDYQATKKSSTGNAIPVMNPTSNANMANTISGLMNGTPNKHYVF